MNPPFLKGLAVRNFKSIESCDVEFGHLSVLVGRNGAGKSNFLDSLHFISDGLQTSLDHAIKSRGGIDAVRRRSTGHPRNFAIALEVQLPGWQSAHYGFEVTARQRGGFSIRRESLRILSHSGTVLGSYAVADGTVKESS